MIRNLSTLKFFTLLCLLLLAAQWAHATTLYSATKPPAAHVVQGQFDSKADQAAFQTALTKALSGEVKIENPSADPSNGDGDISDRFGYSVALSGDTALIGVPFDDVGANADQGSAYVFTRSGSIWTLQTKLTAADGLQNDQFGFSVALNGDTALVGAQFDDVGFSSDQGSTYVFTRNGSNWTQQAQLIASDGVGNDRFGVSVAISGDIALVGAYLNSVGNSTAQGSAYVFLRNGQVWSQQTQLIANDGAQIDQFGFSVALNENTALVGAPKDDLANFDQGSAYVFTHSGGVWNQQAKLFASDGAMEDLFGVSVALDGDTALVGASLDDIGANANQGSAYAFVRAGTSWNQQIKLTSDDGAEFDQFGSAVALNNDTALIGVSLDDTGTNFSQGSAYVFARSGSSWSPQAKLTSGDGERDDEFGISVALSGNTALVGVHLDDLAANVNQGSTFAFTRSGMSWNQQAKITSGKGGANDEFGISVSLSGNTALVGAHMDDVGDNRLQGSAYVFNRSPSGWNLQAKLTASDGSRNDQFGFSVALSGDMAVIGAPSHDLANYDEGAVYIFVREGSNWSQQAKLTASDGAAADTFGHAVALSGESVLASAKSKKIGANFDQGAAYVFVRNQSNWTEQAKLVANDGAAADFFGVAVALDGNTAAIGAHKADVSFTFDQGAAYVFTRNGTNWSQQAKLVATDGARDDQFGISLALSADTILIGAYLDDNLSNTNQGSAYVFTKSGSIWNQQAKLTPVDSESVFAFGAAVALSAETALVAATATNIGQGSAYLFVRDGLSWNQQAKYQANDGAFEDRFGTSISLSADTAIVGVPNDDSNGPFANPNVGSAYFYSIGNLFSNGFE